MLVVLACVPAQPRERGVHVEAAHLGEHPLTISTTPRLVTAASSRCIRALPVVVVVVVVVVFCCRIAMVATCAKAWAKLRSLVVAGCLRRRPGPHFRR